MTNITKFHNYSLFLKSKQDLTNRDKTDFFKIKFYKRSCLEYEQKSYENFCKNSAS